MTTIAILGAGDLGGSIARCLADRDCAARIVLVDPDEGRARGKALDILEAGPVEGSDTRVEGCAGLTDAGTADVVVVADTPELAPHETASHRVGDFMRALVGLVGKGTLLVARADGPPLVEAAVRKGLRRERVLGSAPLALCAALRRRLAAEVGAEPREVTAVLLGLPPDALALPRESASVGGVPIDRLWPVACRRALDAVRGRSLGPSSLAAAAARVLQALAGPRPTVLPVFAMLDGEYGHRDLALAVPAGVGPRGLESVLELPLDPVDRVVLDGAAQRRLG